MVGLLPKLLWSGIRHVSTIVRTSIFLQKRNASIKVVLYLKIVKISNFFLLNISIIYVISNLKKVVRIN